MGMCTYVKMFNDPTSDYYVDDPIFIAGASSLICGVVGIAFMTVFDVAADTMLFCFATETKKQAEQKQAEKPQNAGSKQAGKKDDQWSSIFLCGRKSAPPPPPEEKPSYAPPKLVNLIAMNR